MKNLPSLLLMACLVLPLAACNQDGAKSSQTQRAPLSAPSGEDRSEWAAYVGDAVGRNLGNIVNQPYVYLLPGESHEDFEGSYERLAEKIRNDLARGVLRGNLLAYASPASDKIADIVIEGFTDVAEDSMKGVRVLFIGKTVDGDRVRAAVAPAGVDYVFVDTQQ